MLEGPHTVNMVDSNGITPLHMTAVSGCIETTETLLMAGAYTTARSDGYTPLHLVVLCDRVDVVDRLLNASLTSGELTRVHNAWS